MTHVRGADPVFRRFATMNFCPGIKVLAGIFDAESPPSALTVPKPVPRVHGALAKSPESGKRELEHRAPQYCGNSRVTTNPVRASKPVVEEHVPSVRHRRGRAENDNIR